MKSESKRFADFKIRHNLSYRDISEIVTEYAVKSDDFARTYFTEKYYLSEKVFYKARDFAVTCHLVDDKTCNRLREKASRNNASHNEKKSALSSYHHFDCLFEKRNSFLNTFPKEEIIIITYKYIEGISMRIISDMFEICEETVKKLIKRGIEEVIISNSELECIEKKLKTEGKDLRPLFKMKKVREANKLKTLEPLFWEITVLKNQISNYDTYFLGDANIPKKEFLINRLNEVEKKYRSILEF